MIRHLALWLTLPAVMAAGVTAAKADWMFRPAPYTHDPMTGERVAQYRPKPTPVAPADPTYRRSGYRQLRSSLRGADGSVDRLHLVETWGAGEAIRPYGEWQRPFRAGATPFGPWGNPQGPWTTPYDSWVNPYGLGQLPNPPWGSSYPRPGYPAPYPQTGPSPHRSPGGAPGGYPGGPSGGYPGGPSGVREGMHPGS